MIILLPGGIITDVFRKEKKMLVVSSITTCIVYFALGFLPFFTEFKFSAFLMFISLSTGASTLYAVAWQSYFPETVAAEKRNTIMTIKTFESIVLSIIIPFMTGYLLTHLNNNTHKIIAHQIFFIISAILIIFQINVLRKINPISESVANFPKISLGIIKEACSELLRNNKYLLFLGVIIFFYAAWHMDWTLYYIGQTQYLDFNETQLSYVVIGGTLAQCLTLRFWSRVNKRKGAAFSMLFGIMGLSLCPVSMNIATSISSSVNKPVFIILHAIAYLLYAPISLSLYQCILQVLDEKYKTISISIFSLLVSLSNAVMPVLGVLIYKNLGRNLTGLHKVNFLVFALRIVAACLWWLLWKKIYRK